MKLAKLIPSLVILIFFTASCSKGSGEIFAIKETQLVEVDSKEVEERKNIEEYSMLLESNVNEANFVKASSSIKKYLSIVSENKTIETLSSNIEDLNNSLFHIYKSNAELYLNLINGVLIENQKSPIVIQINQENPDSITVALKTILKSLNVKSKRNKSLSLAEQYLVFNLILNLKESYGLISDKAINELDIGNFVSSMIYKNKLNGNEAIISYQILGSVIANDYDLNLAFSNVFCEIEISEKNSRSQKDIYRRISFFRHEDKSQISFNDASCIQQDIKNLKILAREALSKIKDARKDEYLKLFNDLDVFFVAHSETLMRFSKEKSIDEKVIKELFESQFKEIVYPINLLLQDNKESFLDAFQVFCPNFKSEYLKGVFGLFLASNRDLKINCSYELSVMDLLNKDRTENSQNEMSDLIQSYNLVLNIPIILKRFNTHENYKSFNGVELNKFRSYIDLIQSSVWNLVSDSKDKDEQILKINHCSNLQDVIEDLEKSKEESNEIYLEKGVYCFETITSKKKVFAHPLAVLIPMNMNSNISSKVFVGGIALKYITDSSVRLVKASSSRNVSSGRKATDLHYTQRDFLLKRQTFSCSYKGGGKHGGAEGGCADAMRWLEITKHVYEKSVDRGSAPETNLSGDKGVGGFNLNLRFDEKSIVELSVISMGQPGYKGSKGISSPMCNDRNEYWPLNASEFTYECTTESTNLYTNSNCQNFNHLFNNVKAFHVSAGMPGAGGEGGAGGSLSLTTNKADGLSYPFVSLGGIGGDGGDAPDCIPYAENEIRLSKYKASAGGFGISGSYKHVVVE
ncbi:MAG: hypothetical protein L6Q33_04565 [Bacteriovoracaceae bacterium]|nr:hypothetical protein [Bacteriovoracaceae bacterium]